MIKNLFFIHSFPFSKEAYNSNAFEHFLSVGYQVKFLDIANLIKHCKFEKNYTDFLKQHIISIHSRKEFSSFLSRHKDDSIIVTDVGLLSKTAWVYNSIFKQHIPYILFERPTFQLGTLNRTAQSHMAIAQQLGRLDTRKICRKPQEIFQYLLAKQKKYAPELILTSKERLSAEKRALRTVDTPIFRTVNPDYISAQNTVEEKVSDTPYAVFIDQFFVHHPDFKSKHIIHHFSAKEYYTELNKYLLGFSQQNKLKIIIAAHPRRTDAYKQDFDSTFDLYQNQTAHLIKHAEVVLMHFSTAINFAVIFEKPFLLLNSKLFNKSNIKESIELIAKAFNTTTEDMGKGAINTTSPKVYTAQYEDYFQKYIKAEGAIDKSFKDLLSETLETFKH